MKWGNKFTFAMKKLLCLWQKYQKDGSKDKLGP